MNAFKRLLDIVNSNINAALDKAEEPDKMIDLSIRELEDELYKMKGDLREKKVELKRTKEIVSDLESAVLRWEKRASLAIEKGEEALAREAIIRKREESEKLNVAKDEMAALSSLSEKIEENIRDAEKSLREMRLTSSSLKARAKLAKDRAELERKTNEFSSTSYSRRIEEMKQKIEKWESEGDVASLMRKSERGVSFEELERESEIEKELEELKKRIKDAKKK